MAARHWRVPGIQAGGCVAREEGRGMGPAWVAGVSPAGLELVRRALEMGDSRPEQVRAAAAPPAPDGAGRRGRAGPAGM